MSRSLTIGGTTITDESPGYVIAEIGNNHSGNIETCKQMFKAAKDAGADSVKLQRRTLDAVYSAAYLAKSYDSENSFGSTYGEHRAFLEFTDEQYLALMAYARSLNLSIGVTAFDVSSLHMLVAIGVDYIKIASGDITNTVLLAKAGKACALTATPMIVSTGTAMMHDVLRAVKILDASGADYALLQCQALYPIPAEDLHLKVIETYREYFPETVIGLSSHYSGVLDAALAYQLGARIFEKHFTLDRTAKGTDHAFSLEPSGLRKLRNYLTVARVAMGDGRKRVLPGESGAIEKMGKRVVAARDLPAGHVLTEADFAIKSPGGYPEPYLLPKYIGRVIPRDLAADEPMPSTGDVIERVVI